MSIRLSLITQLFESVSSGVGPRCWRLLVLMSLSMRSSCVPTVSVKVPVINFTARTEVQFQ
jgi:hypothetical protein